LLRCLRQMAVNSHAGLRPSLLRYLLRLWGRGSGSPALWKALADARDVRW